MSKKEEKGAISNKKNKLGNSHKIVVFSILSVIAAYLLFFFGICFYGVQKDKVLHYYEGSNSDYKVFLKENDFYDQKYLGKNMKYVASLIDKIEIDFDYIYNISEKKDIEFTYKTYGILTINDDEGKNYFTKKYNLGSEKKAKMINSKNQNIDDKVVVDYDLYNQLASKFKTNLAVDTKSNLKIVLEINKRNINENDKLSVNGDNEISVNIPLSEKSINIEMDSKNINEANKILEKTALTISGIIYLIFMALSLIILIVCLSLILKTIISKRKKNSKYDLYIKKLLKEYDRLIVETTYMPNLDDFTIIEINKFEELLDVRDNLKLPVMYYSVLEHFEANFYILQDNNLFLFNIKSSKFNK